jgi:hypothetical protein
MRRGLGSEWSCGRREKVGGLDAQSLAVLPHGPFHDLENLEHGLSSRRELYVNGDGSPAGPLRGSVASDPDQVEARELVDQTKERLGMQAETLAHLLIPIDPALLEQREETPRLGVGQDVREVLRRCHHHIT